MESWQGLNYYTTSPERWVHLMNLSTAEFGVAPFPPNVVAIPDTLWNRTNHSIPVWFPNDTIIIENASKAQLGSREVERIVFLITSGLAIAWALFWLWVNWGSLLRPRTSPRAAAQKATTAGTAGSSGGDDDDIELANGGGNLATNPNFISAAEFRFRIKNRYYPDMYSGIDLVEKDVMLDGIDGEDVEEVTQLVQKMYETDLKIWALQNARHRTSETEKQELMRRSDGILYEVRRRVVGEWNREPCLGRWNGDERQLVEGARRILMDNLPQDRYPQKI
ncbi:hypothetical protein QBC37DRAFT_93238 [Rhypophila decipiens]|uniref:Uncharacterized protein n=1 Tax=Rhypophila decipiens TaxID=261697 RepID=A0AAN6Y191_9PEZI|nr:hypothetical protein QBC37DRAFT_93238 [Rhypophila decipiens]